MEGEVISKNFIEQIIDKDLEEGKLNDLIQVKNIKSKKVIQAQVIGPNLVQVIF